MSTWIELPPQPVRDNMMSSIVFDLDQAIFITYSHNNLIVYLSTIFGASNSIIVPEEHIDLVLPKLNLNDWDQLLGDDRAWVHKGVPFDGYELIKDLNGKNTYLSLIGMPFGATDSEFIQDTINFIRK